MFYMHRPHLCFPYVIERSHVIGGAPSDNRTSKLKGVLSVFDMQSYKQTNEECSIGTLAGKGFKSIGTPPFIFGKSSESSMTAYFINTCLMYWCGSWFWAEVESTSTHRF